MSLPDLVPIFGYLGYVLLLLQIIARYADLRKLIMKPNFRLQMRTETSSALIMVTNAKTGNPLKDWFICDATDCEGCLAIKRHETKDDRVFDVIETTPLTWEGEGKISKRLPAGSLPAHLHAFEVVLPHADLRVRGRGEATSWMVPNLRVDVLVQVQSKEKTVRRWMRDIDIRQCIKNGQFPEFVDDDC
jgi:hypothetical protein